MIKLKKLISEKINVNKKDSDENIFDFSRMTEQSWHEMTKEAQDFQNIHFDLENDDSTGEKKVFYVKKNLRKNQPVKYQVSAELYQAGGDWEFPVLYFRIEINHHYGLINSKYYKNPEYIWDIEINDSNRSHKYVIIPPAETGNKIKFEGKKGFAYTSEDKEYNELDITDSDKRKCWKWLQNLIDEAIEKRHEMLD